MKKAAATGAKIAKMPNILRRASRPPAQRNFFTDALKSVKKFPTASGSWLAIWTLGNDISHILANTDWGTDKPHSAKWDTQTVPFSKFTDKDPDWANKFHIWRMDWDAEAIRLYLDDELLNKTLLSEPVNGAVGNYSNPFRQPHYILLNLAIGGDNGGAPDDTAFPLRYEIDYVRMYQKNECI
jgi:beta-glucanase (GH16 family)